MNVNCTVIINHRPIYMSGKYGLTVTRSGQGTAKVKEIATDEQLSAILLAIGHTQHETNELLRSLTRANSDVKYEREIEESALATNGL